jgi:hypothetical protein
VSYRTNLRGRIHWTQTSVIYDVDAAFSWPSNRQEVGAGHVHLVGPTDGLQRIVDSAPCTAARRSALFWGVHVACEVIELAAIDRLRSVIKDF